MRIGIISDTHGTVHPGVVAAFRGVDHIVHAGDIGGTHVIAALEAIAPVTAVVGNVDDARVGQEIDFGPPSDMQAFPHFAHVALHGLRFFVTHYLPRPSAMAAHVAAELRERPADVVIFGHSHLPHDERWRGIWYFNPASAGPRRFDYPTSVGLFEWSEGIWTARHLPLDERSAGALTTRMNQLKE